jgi:hypothetical protein
LLTTRKNRSYLPKLIVNNVACTITNEPRKRNCQESLFYASDCGYDKNKNKQIKKGQDSLDLIHIGLSTGKDKGHVSI